MSARFTILSALLILGVSSAGLSEDAGTEKFAPETKDISNYKLIWESQPFIKETIQQPVLEPGLASQYKLVGLVTSSSESVAFVDDVNQSDQYKRRIMLSRTRPDKDRGIELVSVAANPDIKKSSIVISKGGKQATLNFDTEAVNQLGAGAIPAPNPITPGAVAPLPQTGAIQPPVTNPAAIPAPNPARQIIRQPQQPGGQAASSTVQPPIPPPTGAQSPAPAVRRIVRPTAINAN